MLWLKHILCEYNKSNTQCTMKLFQAKKGVKNKVSKDTQTMCTKRFGLAIKQNSFQTKYIQREFLTMTLGETFTSTTSYHIAYCHILYVSQVIYFEN